MYNPLISVIIPFYNRKKTISLCIDSVLKADYKNLEIILIDDGSNDGSGELAKSYASKLPNVAYFYQQNAGVSVARDRGLENAHGEWITFIDSDDIVMSNHFGIVPTEGQNSDLLMTGSAAYTINNYHLNNSHAGFKFSHPEANKYLLGNGFNPFENVYYSIWDKFFRKEIIDDNNLRFDNTMSLGEDQVFVCEYLKYAAKIVRYTNPTYITLSWDTQMERLGRKLRTPSDYLHNIVNGYEALMDLSKCTGNTYAEKYAINFGTNRSITRILYNFTKDENIGVISKLELFTFLTKELTPFLKSIKTSHYHAQELNIRFSSFLLKTIGAKGAYIWARIWINHLQRPVARITNFMKIPSNFMRYRLMLREAESL